MIHWTTLLLFFSLTKQCVHAQNTTTAIPEKPRTFAISRDIMSNANFGLPNALGTTTSPLKTTLTPEKTCPPDDRWNARRSASFIECLCKVENSDQQPCVLQFSNLLGMYERMVVPAILPRITATDLGFLYLWSSLGFQCHPFMGIGGLSIACYHEIGSFPMSRDCRFSRSQYFCELLICVDVILGNPRSRPQDFLECVRRIAVPVTTPAPMWPPTRRTYPPPPTSTVTKLLTATESSGKMASLQNDEEDSHDHHDHGEHGLDSEHYKMDTIKIVSGVVGGILGGIFLTAVIFIVCWFFKRRSQQQATTQSRDRPKLSIRKQESAVYAEVEDTESESGLVNAAYLSNQAPDVISIIASKGRADDHDYNTLNNYNGAGSSFGSPRGYLGRPPSTDSNQYCTINDNDSLSKPTTRNSVYNKLREDGKSVVCDHVYNRAQFKIHEDAQGNDAYDRVSPKQINCDNPQKTIMKKHPSTASNKKRVYFTLEPTEHPQKKHDDP